MKLWLPEFKIEGVTVSATFCTATSKVGLPDFYPAHNTFHKIDKYLEIFNHILDTYFNVEIFVL